MASSVEIRRVISEWKLRLERARAALQPRQLDGEEWKRFCQTLTLIVRKHGATWTVPPLEYWDLRWATHDGGELICQVEHQPDEKTTLIVAQEGGFAADAGSYTWLWAEFGLDGQFSREPYWVDGNWREALMMLLMPYQFQSGLYLEAPVPTPVSLMLGQGPSTSPPEP
jgi:hypothetical protein